MKTKEQLQKKYLGRRVKNRHGYLGTVTEVDDFPDDTPTPLAVTFGSDRLKVVPHQLTLFKPKKNREPITRERFFRLFREVFANYNYESPAPKMVALADELGLK